MSSQYSTASEEQGARDGEPPHAGPHQAQAASVSPQSGAHPNAQPPQPQAAQAAGGQAGALPALFWDAAPEEGVQHADQAAMDAMMAELGPLQKALNFKVQGNDALKRGLQLRKKFYLRQAQEFYSQGLAVHCGDAAVDAVLYSNRAQGLYRALANRASSFSCVGAQVELQLGNDRNALTDSVAALRLDSSQFKACFRGARAALRLQEWERAMELCRSALALEPVAPEVLKLLREAELGAQQQAEREKSEAQRRSAAREPARQLATALLSQGWRLGLPQITIGSRKPQLVEGGEVSWPVLFLYPSSMQTDSVEAFHQRHSFAEHLDVMFSPEAPALEWDTKGEYTRSSIELYYLSNAATPMDAEQLTEVLFGGWPQEPPSDEGPQRYGKDRSAWVKVKQSSTLGEALQRPDYVVPGVPVFFVVAKGTAYRERFLLEQI